MTLLYFIICFGASIIGAICGIGGGVIIKPLLDMFQLDSASTISFLSGCTVLSMSCYSVFKSVLNQEHRVKRATGIPLALGASVGGVAGNQLFSAVKSASGNERLVGLLQAVCLAVVTLGTFIYILRKEGIRTHRVRSLPACALIGLALGLLSSFLGIGGGPINLVVLSYFFSMDTKTAAANSLTIILFSQAANLITAIALATVPVFRPLTLAIMVLGGIGGGILGRFLNRRMDNRAVDRLMLLLMAVIILICVYNSSVILSA